MDTNIETLGECTMPSPLLERFKMHEKAFVSDDMRVRLNVFTNREPIAETDTETTFETAGPRKNIFFNPQKIRSAVVTCGGLCPGVNDVIRSIVMTTHYIYGSREILGIRYGYSGLNPEKGYDPIKLTPDLVENIHGDGGTILASSRGGTENMDLLVDTLENWRINILYTIGGDGTIRGAHKISDIARKRGMNLSVIGVPKTIDNDISHIARSFGFETAFSEAVKAITTAHVEAKGAPNGIGLVKLMGRHSGFIAANATIAMNDVNYVFVPEVPFELEGKNGFLMHLRERILNRKHAVICVAEGAGQNLLAGNSDGKSHDASGNLKLKDIGVYLKNKIQEYFDREGIEINIKYIDPSYMIRSAPANANDSLFCHRLGQFAVHAGMAGKTDMVIGIWNNIFTHVPFEVAVSKRKQIDPNSRFWFSVINSTGQPVSMVND